MIIQILTKIAFHLRTLKMNLFENSYSIVKIFSFIYQRTMRWPIKTLCFAARGNF